MRNSKKSKKPMKHFLTIKNVRIMTSSVIPIQTKASEAAVLAEEETSAASAALTTSSQVFLAAEQGEETQMHRVKEPTCNIQ